jgi:hypothetical protein
VARKKAAAGPKKGRARGASAEPAADAGLDVEEVGEARPAKPPMGLESALILVTFLALLTAFLLVQVKMHSAFGKGWPV